MLVIIRIIIGNTGHQQVPIGKFCREDVFTSLSPVSYSKSKIFCPLTDHLQIATVTRGRLHRVRRVLHHQRVEDHLRQRVVPPLQPVRPLLKCQTSDTLVPRTVVTSVRIVTRYKYCIA